MSNKQDCHEYEHYKQCKQHNALYIHALTSVSQNSNLHWEMQMVLHSVTHLSLTEVSPATTRKEETHQSLSQENHPQDI